MSENRIKQHKFAGKKEIIRETRRNVNVQVFLIKIDSNYISLEILPFEISHPFLASKKCERRPDV